ncbi:transcriptional regulator, HxlR family [Microbispora rosea]|uniref:Transcriptional regulator, HxlR family n=1 Tax=Microbispora rosea TaxID=58117 RepID=A0A1N7CNW9_9ACTN|nr:helix-turn-helix domain-containing protein [Microbispora rosea]GIH46405.1 HxlR family transcriptional regulator [Microbispora rosea subsp. rosea]SIR65292.1 transcriptional regulator, HxlR family [Microbispora rosea]
MDESDARWISDTFHSDCPGQEVMEHVTGRWVPLILAALAPGPMRFFELRRRIEGISEKMLSAKLRILVRDGLVARTVEPTTPPQVSYELTKLGQGLSRPFAQLVRWISAHTPEVIAAQQRFDHSANPADQAISSL